MKFLHTMIRVKDLDASIRFYCEALGFKLRKRQDFEKGQFTLVFLSSEEGDTEIELTHNWGHEPYQIGNGFGHMAFGVKSVEEIGRRLAEHGSGFSWGPGKTPDGRYGMAFVEDPDGYEIELLER